LRVYFTKQSRNKKQKSKDKTTNQETIQTFKLLNFYINFIQIA
jgi:hypothetical protein